MGYKVLCVLGAVVPLSPAIYFLLTHQFDVGLFIQQAIASAASVTAWLDVIISAGAVLTLAIVEGRRLGMEKLWVYGLATVLVGPSLGLPLFLYRRSQRLDSLDDRTTAALGQD
ncbi:MAG: DUF2834 domain-containing protein [Leptolyngbyaceae cyanobacterium MO_188.B28]|nr:DUF2834 domain-containing protein [Leptolyngbyaceae cyanobacterium MO_188.B28]